MGIAGTAGLVGATGLGLARMRNNQKAYELGKKVAKEVFGIDNPERIQSGGNPEMSRDQLIKLGQAQMKKDAEANQGQGPFSFLTNMLGRGRPDA